MDEINWAESYVEWEIIGLYQWFAFSSKNESHVLSLIISRDK